MNRVEKLKVQIFADGADKAGMLEMYKKKTIFSFFYELVSKINFE